MEEKKESIINHPDFIKVWNIYRKDCPSFIDYCQAVENAGIEDIEELRSGSSSFLLNKRKRKNGNTKNV